MQLYLSLFLNLILISAGTSPKSSQEDTSDEEYYGSNLTESTMIEDYDAEDYPTRKTISEITVNLVTEKDQKLKLTVTRAAPKMITKMYTPRPTTFKLSRIEAHTMKNVDENSCHDSEVPLSVGRFMIPTAQDMLIITKKIIVKYFNIHQKKASYFLNDMKSAMTAVRKQTPYCTGIKRKWYKRCLQHVKSVSDTITKNMLRDLEKKRLEVSNYTSEKNCDEASMKESSFNLLEWLAIENVSMEFALPAFLRIIYACTVHCSKNVIPPETNYFFQDENLANMIWAVKNHFKKREFKRPNSGEGTERL